MRVQEQIISVLDTINSKGFIDLEDIPERFKTTVSQVFNFKNSVTGIDTELTHQLDLVKQLRQAFLREAMQGQLLPQDATDEPARDLLARIQAEKARLVKEKKIKKSKPLPPIEEEEIPFDIPEHWVWCRLGEICESSFYGPRFSNSDYVKDGIPTIRTTDMTEDGRIEILNAPTVYVDDEKKLKLYKVEDGDLLVTRSGSIGIMAVFRGDYVALPSAYLIRFRFMEPIVPEYIFDLLKSPFWQQLMGLSSSATAQVNINATKMWDFPIPLPPLAEQQRIVARLDELMESCDALEASIGGSVRHNEQLLQQVLREALEVGA